MKSMLIKRIMFVVITISLLGSSYLGSMTVNAVEINEPSLNDTIKEFSLAKLGDLMDQKKIPMANYIGVAVGLFFPSLQDEFDPEAAFEELSEKMDTMVSRINDLDSKTDNLGKMIVFQQFANIKEQERGLVYAINDYKNTKNLENYKNVVNKAEDLHSAIITHAIPENFSNITDCEKMLTLVITSGHKINLILREGNASYEYDNDDGSSHYEKKLKDRLTELSNKIENLKNYLVQKRGDNISSVQNPLTYKKINAIVNEYYYPVHILDNGSVGWSGEVVNYTRKFVSGISYPYPQNGRYEYTYNSDRDAQLNEWKTTKINQYRTSVQNSYQTKLEREIDSIDVWNLPCKIKKSPVAKYDLNRNFFDRTGNGNTPTFIGKLNWINEGIEKGALFFDGNSHADVPYNEKINPSSCTVELWVNPKAQINMEGIVLTTMKSSKGFKFSIINGFKDEGKWNLKVGYGNYNDTTIEGPTVQMNQWSHLVATMDNSTKITSFYVNGKLAGSVKGEYAPNIEAPLRFGAYIDNYESADSEYYFQFKGSMDEVAIYNKVYTSDQISNMYNEYVK